MTPFIDIEAIAQVVTGGSMMGCMGACPHVNEQWLLLVAESGISPWQ